MSIRHAFMCAHGYESRYKCIYHNIDIIYSTQYIDDHIRNPSTRMLKIV